MEPYSFSILDTLRDKIHRARKVLIENGRRWIEKHLSLNQVKTAALKGNVEVDFHQRLPLKLFLNEETRRITVISCPQTGKSFSWQVGVTCLAAHGDLTAWIVYENEKKYKAINEDVMQPLFRSYAPLRDELAKPHAKNQERFKLGSSIVRFSGSDAELSSHPTRVMVGSEVDRWVNSIERNYHVFRTFDERISTYEKLNQSKVFVESSGSIEGNIMSMELTKNEILYWCLKCLKCDEYIPAYQDERIKRNGEYIGGFHYQRDETNKVIEESIRYQCPHCLTKFKQEQAKALNERGAYCRIPKAIKRKGQKFYYNLTCFIEHKPEFVPYEEIIKNQNISLQNGGLSGWRSLKWLKLASLVNECHINPSEKVLESRDTRSKGLWYMPKKVKNEEKRELLLAHSRQLPDPDTLSSVIFSSDTQGHSWKWVIRGFDQQENSYRLAYGEAFSMAELANVVTGAYGIHEDKLQWQYHDAFTGLSDDEIIQSFYDVDEFFDIYEQNPPQGLTLKFGIIDEGGHRGEQVRDFVQNIPMGSFYLYKGESNRAVYKDADPKLIKVLPNGEDFKLSENVDKLILAQPDNYKALVLGKIYTWQNTKKAYWFLPPQEEIGEDYINEILIMQAPRGKDKAPFKLWKAGANDGGIDDYMDAEKMLYVAYHFAKIHYAEDFWLLPMPWHS